MKRYGLLTLTFLLCFALNAFGQGSWTFVSANDWHLGEDELSVSAKQEVIDVQLNAIKDMQQYSPRLLLLDGDLASGPWVGAEWISRFAPGGSQEEAIRNVCKIVYGNLKKRFEENGFDRILVAVGDHEIGDDSNWKTSSEVSHLLPVYRDAFQEIWNKDRQGIFIFSEPVGSAESRPVGTPWENTSFAFRHRNVLFVTVDIFDQPDPDKRVENNLNKDHSIYANMPEAHLQWFENVLKEARKAPEIKHIIVQAHCPVLSPVRGQRTSMLYVENMEESSFWKIMQKYRVDLYFAGEVHAPSALQNGNRFPVQVTHGIGWMNYLVVEVSEDELRLQLREMNVYDKTYSSVGEMVVDKSSKRGAVYDQGVLGLLREEEPLLHYTFDEKKDDAGNPSLGSGFLSLALNPGKNKEIPNAGWMGRYYNLVTAAELSEGVRGKAIRLNGSGFAQCQGSGVMVQNHAATFLAWVKTRQKDASCIVSNGNGTENLDIVMKDGMLGVYTANSCLQTSGSVALNDGEWHQVAIVIPEKTKSLRNVKLYVDGKRQDIRLTGDDHPIMVNPAYQMKLGSSDRNKQLGLQPFSGLIDEFLVWYQPLSDKKIREEFNKICELGVKKYCVIK